LTGIDGQIVLFAAVGAVLVVSTTVVVGREWTGPPQREPSPEWHAVDTTSGFEITDDDMDEKEEDGTDGAENSNVLHLLYTIAQVIFCP
jgi:hypothetical protein